MLIVVVDVAADYTIYEQVVNATHKLKPIFYDE